MKSLPLNMKNLHLESVNWFALAGGALTLVLAVASLSVPWWQLTIGETLAKVGFSPVNTSTNILGYSTAIPIINAINWMFMLLLISAGTVLIIYAFTTSKPYSKRLLTFAYKKPLGTVISFLILLLIITNAGTIAGMIAGSSNLSGADLNIPWNGAKTLRLPSNMAQGVLQGITISTELGWTFWLAITVAALCIAARLYHKKLEPPTTVKKNPQPAI